MEKENRRVNKAYCNLIKNQNEAHDWQADSKTLSDEKRMQGEKHFRIRMSNEEERKKEQSDGVLQTNTMFGPCTICHHPLGNINSSFNNHVPCSEGHMLCERCIQHFIIPSAPGCILCHPQFQQSNISLSRESNTSFNSIHMQTRTQVSRQQPKHYMHQRVQQCMPLNVEESYVKTWNQNHLTTSPNIEQNVLGYYNIQDSEESFDYEQIKDQSNTREEGNICKPKQQYSYYDLYQTKVNGQITSECSRRPIRCPRIDCAINVAFSALTHHFIFDHPEVPILNVEPGIKSTLIVSFSALSSHSSLCLALLLVSGKLSDPVARLFNGNQMNPKFRNRLPLPVLAARLHSRNHNVFADKSNNNKNFHEKDIIIAWVAGLDIGNTAEKLLCSIQAVDKIDSEGLRSLTYTGPVNSLRTAQCPEDIFSTGDCIVLHEGLLNHITSNCATLNVNVTVH
ncbi:uncharacterized protein LOC128896267 [Hylaeus anthracinus]|uniref:uncharacterized protein LOC128896267 n=1 Tax=Hylaeus anthracinus TaxID=313031 RepID=UPI0023B97E33|nr:uncharacterized protein LOC128896267 [Hylaeus anthracinus]